MSFLPFPPTPLTILHTSDILLLLTYGILHEFLLRLYLHLNSKRTSHERKLQIHLATLRYEAARKRALGPSAFVEASKLERAVLATEKELGRLVEDREARTAKAGKVVKRLNLFSNVVILLVYWGVAMLAVDGSRIGLGNESNGDDAYLEKGIERANAFWAGLWFPMSYHGLGYKIAQFGIQKDMKQSCVGALAVVWSARVFCGEVVDCALAWWSR